ncbi:HD-GYP domain-containing protein [Cohnella lupini]|uniref:HD-GYP domain-containing protein (C-di-GMP phosphodiesterase class II) n=1 Tax=Cohnella lupini TaxID=1294267 RepID=A0A3D9I794_9BACL|nr:HD domain-containing phosphohydrolase [Cohnella lupini]RED57664.1 HD-GYP domain-containing protein (c-di-GMP phosphodiesterase class II) [Cohnella lupini]
MRIVGISELEIGDVLARPVQGNNGIVMLEAGTKLTEQYIHRLRALKIKFVHLTVPSATAGSERVLKGRSSEENTWIRPDIDKLKNDEYARREAVKLVAEFADRSLMLERIALPFPEGNFRERFRDILLEITSQPALAEELGVLMLTDRMLFEHALNVTLCSSVIGTAQKFDSAKLYELSVGAMFCDIGMTRLPTDFTKVNRELKENELTVLRQHTNEGYRVLKGMKEIPLASAQCALLHHERYSGSGYPMGVTNANIPEFAQIVGLSDVYNALGSPRHHRNAYGPSEAIEYLFASGNYDFEWDLIKSFLNLVVIYPVSTLVKLSNGQTASVMETASRPLQRPIVQVLREADDSVAIVPYLLDLQRHTNIVIVGKADK